MPSSRREKVDIASTIKHILDSYPFGKAILRELIQNSDDAGAKKQIFILDARQHGVESVVDRELRNTQGASLLAVNDSVFKPSDWEALVTIHGSNKRNDETKIGKYGLGFRACYHLTDNPHILSREQLLVLDPHGEFQPPFTEGVELDILQEARLYPDQFDAFKAAIESPRQPYDGTVVRLPLRTEEQAARSKIKSAAVTVQDIQKMFHQFLDNEAQVVLLFLKHLTSIEVKEVDIHGTERVLGKVTICNADSIAGQRSFTRQAKSVVLETFKCTIQRQLFSERPTSTVWRILHSIQSNEETSAVMARRLGYEAKALLAEDKLFSHVALAYPLQPSGCNGRLFTLLPLPISTGFPLQAHGILALTPDRQSLRNREESLAGELRSRERLLVEWNNAIFEDFFPSAWATLLQKLAELDNAVNIWDVLPSSMSPEHAKTSYWGRILPDVLKAVVASGQETFPAFDPVSKRRVALSTPTLLAHSEVQDSVLSALHRAKLTIVQPPCHVLNILEQFSEITLLSPSSAHHYLQALSREDLARLLNSGDKDILLNYLVTKSTTFHFSYASHLPIIPLSDGSRSYLLHTTNDARRHILVEDTEATLFGHMGDLMISKSHLSQHLLEAFSSSRASEAGIYLLNVRDVLQYLHRILGGLDPAEDEVPIGGVVSIHWLQKFWSWVGEWSGRRELLSGIQEFHLLPTSLKTCRKIQCNIALSEGITSKATQALAKLGVPFLHSSIPTSELKSVGLGKSAADIPFLLESATYQRISDLDAQDWQSLQKHVIQAYQHGPIRLSKEQIRKFSLLHVFPIRRGTESRNGKLSYCSMGPLSTERIVFINVGDTCPLPALPETTFVDVSKTSRVLALMTDPKAVATAWGELEVLKSAIPHLSSQGRANLVELTSRILHRFLDIPENLQRVLQSIPFIPVYGSESLSAPKDVVDPESILAGLFKGENSKFPSDTFPAAYLSVLRSSNFLQSHLTWGILCERVKFISEHQNREKSVILLDLLDASWSKELDGAISRSAPWLFTTSGTFCSADTCRDRCDEYLFDLILPVVDTRVKSPGFRRALGWDQGISSDIVLEQFSATLSQATNRPERLLKLIRFLARLSANNGLSLGDLNRLRDNLKEKAWVPITEKEIICSRYLLFSDLKLFPPFRKVPRTLSGDQCVSFLTLMGCTASPSIECMLQELHDLASGSRDIASAIAILDRLAHMNFEHLNYVLPIMIPDKGGHLRQANEIYYDDSIGSFPVPITDLFPAHPMLSKSTASGLRIPFLNSLLLGDDDSDDSLDDQDMEEDLVSRINGVLKDYDIQYALNEFIANAVDAGSKKFSILLDQKTYEFGSVISPEMISAHQSPSLVLYNDAIFQTSDFRGLRKIGYGGKRHRSDTIGRYGLGALSLFHFTELPTVVSGSHVMILDPSGDILPRRNGRKRTSLFRRLETIFRKFPDQLVPFQSLFGFSTSQMELNGTLFRLPLRTLASDLSSKCVAVSDCLNLLNGHYLELARCALFFTPLDHVSAYLRSPSGLQSELWFLSADRREVNIPKTVSQQLPTSTAQRLSIASSTGSSDKASGTSEEWLTVSDNLSIDSVPVDCKHALEGMKLTTITHSLAFRLSPNAVRKYHLFCNLQLPETTSLQFHIHAPFSIASDRRSIRFDPPDSLGRRLPQAAYNSWILKVLIPPLFQFGLSALESQFRLEHSNPTFYWWPQVTATDAISSAVVEGFHVSLPECSHRLFWTAARELVSPVEATFTRNEPSVVRKCLLELQISGLVFTGPDLLPSHVMEKLTTVTPLFLAQCLLDSTKGQRFMQWFNRVDRQDLKVSDVDTILRYLMTSGISPLRLPLLLRADRSLSSFRGMEQPSVYICDSNIPFLFPPHRFLARDIPHSTCKLLVETPDLNVKLLDLAGIMSLLDEQVEAGDLVGHNSKTANWISNIWREDFWVCVTEVAPNESDRRWLDKYPIIPTYQEGVFVSAEYCRRNCNNVLPSPDQSFHLHPWMVRTFQIMGVHIIRPTRYLNKLYTDQFSFTRILNCIEAGRDAFARLSANDYEDLAAWIREAAPREVLLASPKAAKLHLKRMLTSLSIWRAHKQGTFQLLPASNGGFVEFSSDLLSCINGQPMSLPSLVEALVLPSRLSTAELEYYIDLVRTLLDQELHSTSQILTKLTIPDGFLNLTSAEFLYDFSVQLFATAFRNSETTHFVHHSLRGEQQRLRKWGLVHQITYHSFLACAKAIEGDSRDPSSEIADLTATAGEVYRYYDQALPVAIMSDRAQWSVIDKVRFVPRMEERRPHGPVRIYDLDWERYCRPLPRCVAPAELVRTEFMNVAWTQKALFETDPSTNLLILNSGLGAPQLEEVIAHLVVLCCNIAHDFPGNRSLLQCIRDTYAWLNERSEGARSHLLDDEHCGLPLFLNVDDPEKELWIWCTAEQLVFNLHFDEANLFYVRSFLGDNYQDLCLAAGASVMAIPGFQMAEVRQLGRPISEFYNEMRLNNQLTDLILRPRQVEDGYEPDRLCAHASFLAASIPHMREALIQGWGEAKAGEYEFPGTFFGASKVLEFAYTGKIQLDKPKTLEEASEILTDLLELLEVAEYWDMQDLKANIEKEIAVDLELITPETYDMIQKYATDSGATALVAACEDFCDKNRSLLQTLSKGGSDTE